MLERERLKEGLRAEVQRMADEVGRREGVRSWGVGLEV